MARNKFFTVIYKTGLVTDYFTGEYRVFITKILRVNHRRKFHFIIKIPINKLECLIFNG